MGASGLGQKVGYVRNLASIFNKRLAVTRAAQIDKPSEIALRAGRLVAGDPQAHPAVKPTHGLDNGLRQTVRCNATMIIDDEWRLRG
jgi:hypothetical protein